MTTATVSRETFTPELVPVAMLRDNPYQPRQSHDIDALVDLARSIHRDGLQQVPAAREVGNARPGYQLLYGHRRRLAYALLAFGPGFVKDAFGVPVPPTGLLPDPDEDSYGTMPVRIVAATDEEMYRHAATENAQRMDLNPIEVATSIQAAVDAFGYTVEEAAQPYGYSRSAASNLVRLLRLPDEVQELIAQGKLSASHGRELLRLPEGDPDRANLARAAALFEWPRRELEGAVNRQLARPEVKSPNGRTVYTGADKVQNGQAPETQRDGVADHEPQASDEPGVTVDQLLAWQDEGLIDLNYSNGSIIHEVKQDRGVAVTPDTIRAARSIYRQRRNDQKTETPEPVSGSETTGEPEIWRWRKGKTSDYAKCTIEVRLSPDEHNEGLYEARYDFDVYNVGGVSCPYRTGGRPENATTGATPKEAATAAARKLQQSLAQKDRPSNGPTATQRLNVLRTWLVQTFHVPVQQAIEVPVRPRPSPQLPDLEPRTEPGPARPDGDMITDELTIRQRMRQLWAKEPDADPFAWLVTRTTEEKAADLSEHWQMPVDPAAVPLAAEEERLALYRQKMREGDDTAALRALVASVLSQVDTPEARRLTRAAQVGDPWSSVIDVLRGLQREVAA